MNHYLKIFTKAEKPDGFADETIPLVNGKDFSNLM